jgi:hypothetical protein
LNLPKAKRGHIQVRMNVILPIFFRCKKGEGWARPVLQPVTASTERGVFAGGAKQSFLVKLGLRNGDRVPVRLGRLRAISHSIAGTRDDGFVTRHCEHRARNFAGGAKPACSGRQSHILKLTLNSEQRLPSLNDLPQILPFRVHMVDQINFSLPRAAFDLLLSFDSFFNRRKAFIKHKLVQVIACGKTFRIRFLFVLNYPREQIGCDTSVECFMIFVGHDVNTAATFHRININTGSYSFDSIFVIRHCEHRARVFCGSVKQSPLVKLGFDLGIASRHFTCHRRHSR